MIAAAAAAAAAAAVVSDLGASAAALHCVSAPRNAFAIIGKRPCSAHPDSALVYVDALSTIAAGIQFTGEPDARNVGEGFVV